MINILDILKEIALLINMSFKETIKEKALINKINIHAHENNLDFQIDTNQDSEGWDDKLLAIKSSLKTGKKAKSPKIKKVKKASVKMATITAAVTDGYLEIEIDPKLAPEITAILIQTKVNQYNETYNKLQLENTNTNVKKETFAEKAKAAALRANVTPFIEAHLDLTTSERANTSRKNALRKIRCIITTYDTQRQAKGGEVITTRNSHSGQIKEFVNFNSQEPQHLAVITVNALRETRMQKFVKDGKSARNSPTLVGKLAPAFNIVELPPLTSEEVIQLKKEKKEAILAMH